jgi:hypothetical protein
MISVGKGSQLIVSGEDGSKVTIDLSGVDLAPQEKAALKALLNAKADPSRLSEEQRKILGRKKAIVKADATTDLVCRFDVKCVKID